MSLSPPSPALSTSPILIGYQRRWLADQTRLKILTKSRRIGGSFVVALEGAASAIGLTWQGDGSVRYDPKTGVDQNIVSASHSQAMDLLEESGKHLDALEHVVGHKLVASLSRTRIVLTNGHRLVALSANPRTIRGARGDLILDEFGVMPRSADIWQAAKSIIDPTLGRAQGYRLRVVGTPCGDGNLFYEFSETPAGDEFSRHRCDIHQALREGFPADIERLRREAHGSDHFAQEYELSFLSAVGRYISPELYDRALFGETDANGRPCVDEKPAVDGIGYAGMDVARSPTGDLSAIMELRRINETLWQSGLCETERGASWKTQRAWADAKLERCGRLAVDATGMGSQFAEELVEAHSTRVEPVEFTNTSKESLATGLKRALENASLRLLREDVELRRDVLSLRREITKHGNTRFDAARTAGKGHADRAWALALAVHAAGAPIPTSAGSGTGIGSDADRFAESF